MHADINVEDMESSMKESGHVNDDKQKDELLLNIDKQAETYRQEKQGSVQVVSSVIGPSIINQHVIASAVDVKEEEKNKLKYDPNYAAYKLML